MAHPKSPLRGEPSYLEVARRLESWLQAQGLGPGARLPAEREWARLLGVSRAAVSRALLSLVAGGRIRREGRKAWLQQPARAGGLPPFTVVSPIAAAHRVAREQAAVHGVGCEILDCADISQVAGQMVRLLEAGCGGLLVWPPLGSPRVLEQIRAHRIPCVVIGGQVPGLNSLCEDLVRRAWLAVEHLRLLGHERLAFCTTASPRSEAENTEVQGYRAACVGQGLAEAAGRVYEIERVSPVQLRRLCDRLLAPDAANTAAICQSGSLATGLIAALPERGLRVPDDFSILLCGESATAARVSPPLTTIGGNDSDLALLAVNLLLQRMRERQYRGTMSPPLQMTAEPRLTVRGSTGACPGRKPLPVPAVPDQPPPPHMSLGEAVLLLPEEQRRQLAAATWQASYRLAAAPGAAFAELDLRPLVNRSVARRNGWLGGQPLLSLPTGSLRVHGVPFTVTPDPRRAGGMALVLRPRGARRGRRPLPAEALVPIGRPARAVYVLHGCGFVGGAEAFGAYEWVYADGRSASVPLVPYGMAARQPDDEARRQAATIQDWWPGFPPLANARARYLLVTKGGDPSLYERYLYTLEWVNPRPAEPLAALRIRMSGPEPVSLGVLAVTLLV